MKLENSCLFDSIVPFAGPVRVAELLDEIEAIIKRHVVLSPHAAAALAVWVLHTYTFELRDAVAYVAIESPEKRCGKTTLVSVLAAMAHKPLIASNITLSALFRSIDTCRPTLFIDEADTFLAGNGAMRGVINSGNTWRTAYVLRLAKSRQKSRLPEQAPPTGEAGLKRYSCWCPKVIALIGQTPDTVADRSIVVKMNRKLVTEPCAPLAELNAAEIKSKCARFALDTGPALARAPRIHGAGLNDRAADTFDPLYVIARQAGAQWEKRLHEAALALTASVQEENPGTELLLDIFSIFIELGCEKIFSRDLAALLRDGKGGLRSMPMKETALDEFHLSKILRSYGIRPTTLRIGKEVNKGYLNIDFREALTHYVPKAVIDARVQELLHCSQLQAEAKSEAQSPTEAKEKFKK